MSRVAGEEVRGLERETNKHTALLSLYFYNFTLTFFSFLLLLFVGATADSAHGRHQQGGGVEGEARKASGKVHHLSLSNGLQTLIS